MDRLMNVVQQSRLDWDEFSVENSPAAAIDIQPGKVKIHVPAQMTFRNLYCFIEAIPAVSSRDFELVAELQCRRNGGGVLTLPMTVASNSNDAGVVTQTRLFACPNVNSGTAHGILATFSNPLTGGSNTASLTPHAVQLEIDEIWLNILSATAEVANTFTGWRALVACRSSLLPIS